jgi:hypothetical protein
MNRHDGGMRQLLSLGKRNVKLTITIRVPHPTTVALKNAIQDVMGVVPPVIQQFRDAGFDHVELRTDIPRYKLNHLVGKSQSEVAEAMVSLPRRKYNSVLIMPRNRSSQRRLVNDVVDILIYS